MKTKLIWLLLLSTLGVAEVTKPAPKATDVKEKPKVVRTVPDDIAKNLIIAYQKAAIAQKDTQALQRQAQEALARFNTDVEYLKKLEADTNKLLGFPEGTDFNVDWDKMTATPIFPPEKAEVTAVPAEKK